MSDYLTHLAARAIDAAATIRPRLASLYEPLQVTTATPELEAAESSVDTESSVREPPRAPEPRAKNAEHRVAVTEVVKGISLLRTEAARETEPIATPARPMESRPAPKFAAAAEGTETPRVQVRPVERHVERQAENRPPLPRITPEAPRAAEDRPHPAMRERAPTQSVERVVERIREIAAPAEEAEERQILVERVTQIPGKNAPPPIVARPAAPSRTIVQPPAEASRNVPRREADPTPHVMPSVRAAARISIEPHAMPRPQRPVTQRIVQHEPDATPSIQVTIGRIEVRAIPPAEPPVRNVPAPASSMSLDDYLRRRAERPRR